MTLIMSCLSILCRAITTHTKNAYTTQNQTGTTSTQKATSNLSNNATCYLRNAIVARGTARLLKSHTHCRI